MARKTSKMLPGWQREGNLGTKIGAIYFHAESGWVVRHCSHPTANWPYYAIDPNDPERRVAVTHNGQGFRTAQLAMEAVEGVLAGTVLNTIEGCGSQTRRLLTLAELEDWRVNARIFGDKTGR